jgi:hypothetical protein
MVFSWRQDHEPEDPMYQSQLPQAFSSEPPGKGPAILQQEGMSACPKKPMATPKDQT